MGLILVSCAKQQSVSLKNSTETATGAIGCKPEKLQSKIFDSLYSYLDQEKETPDLADLQYFISEKIDQIAQEQNIKDFEKIKKYKIEFNKIFEIMLSEAKDIKNIPDAQAHLRTLIELEMHDQTNPAQVQLNKKLSRQFSKVEQMSQSLELSCNDSTANPPDNTPPINNTHPPVVNSRMVAGMSNVISTAYQSCEALRVPALDASTPNVSGITRLAQNHPDGIGGRRVIGNLLSVQQTHPYIRVAGQVTNSSCFDVSDNPLIYDYGGEPSVTNNTLSFFKDAGSGTSVLGVDCSALVSSAAAAGGLRYRAGVDNKAIFIRQTSEKFIDAAASGFSCFQNITVTPSESLKAGDIAAVRGHVVMIDSLGVDPFGLKKLSDISQCSSLDVRNFDFIVAQSSPSKGGLGINKFVAKDYLLESPKMYSLFMGIGIQACKAYFNKSKITPQNPDWGVIRHKGTAECLAPKIQMSGQACVSQCQM